MEYGALGVSFDKDGLGKGETVSSNVHSKEKQEGWKY